MHLSIVGFFLILEKYNDKGLTSTLMISGKEKLNKSLERKEKFLKYCLTVISKTKYVEVFFVCSSSLMRMEFWLFKRDFLIFIILEKKLFLC